LGVIGMNGVDPNRKGLQRLTCGCIVEIRYGSPLYETTCPEATKLFTALIRSPKKNERQCSERDELRKHIGMGE
jgi:hypothetical protein